VISRPGSLEPGLFRIDRQEKLVKYIALAVLVLASSAAVHAQKTPTFAAYSAKVEKIKTINVNLASNKDARRFRTNLRNAAKEGVNFAGHFILTGWGCGTNCEQMAIIELAGVGVGFCDGPEGAVAKDAPAENEYLAATYFKKDSRLLVFQGFKGGDLNKPKSGCGNYYWEWTGNSLKQVSFKRGKRTDTP
jgi:hypothetical protein